MQGPKKNIIIFHEKKGMGGLEPPILSLLGPRLNQLGHIPKKEMKMYNFYIFFFVRHTILLF